MKFSLSKAILGTRAERKIDLPRADGVSFEMVVRPLTGTEEALVLEHARAYAKGKGLEKPVEGEPLFDLGVMVHTIAVGCLDTDSPANAREPAFDGGADQVLDELGREEIAFLYERHQLWQDECSPTIKRMTPAELLAEAVKITEATDDGPFVRLRPALRLILMRTLGRLLLSSPNLKSLSGSLAEAPGAASNETPQSDEKTAT